MDFFPKHTVNGSLPLIFIQRIKFAAVAQWLSSECMSSRVKRLYSPQTGYGPTSAAHAGPGLSFRPMSSLVAGGLKAG